MVLQFVQLDLPLPDLIVPVPQSFTRTLMRGYNPCLLLAKEIGKQLDRPVLQPLRRLSGDLPQAALSREQRKTLNRGSFVWKQGMDINEKVVLLIDDVRTTGMTLNHSGELLLEGYPEELYAMTLCM